MNSLKLVLLLSILCSSCGTLINPRYVKLSKERQETLTPPPIKNYESFYSFNNDSSYHTIYKSTASELLQLIKTSNKPFIMVVFYAYFCGPCRQNMPTVLEFQNKHNDQLNLIFVSSCDWADINSERAYLTKYQKGKSSIIIDINSYGTKFSNWDRLSSFLRELVPNTSNKSFGFPYYLLFDLEGVCKAEILGNTDFSFFHSIMSNSHNQL